MQRIRSLSLLCIAWLLISTADAVAQSPPAESQDPHGILALRAAIEDGMALAPAHEAQGRDYLARLQQLIPALEQASGEEADRRAAELATLRREALAANPLVSSRPLLFVARPQYRADHHNTATMFQTGEINTGSFQGGGALKTIDLATGAVTTLLDVPDGVARDPDVSFDGTRILFSMRRNREDDYHIYEINADGSGLRQITFGSGLSDIDPIYLPDERILFTSTREPKYCMCNRHIMGNLFTMDADGSNMQQIGRSTLHEGHAALLPDGRILYDRWEYVDRNFGDAQGVWSCNPDGTNHAVYWGNNTNSPGAVLDARVIPGTELMLANFSSCHDRPWGALAIVDRRLGLDGRTPVLRTWPADAIELVGKGNYDTFVGVNPKYEDPYPLSDKVFLCARMTGRGEETGIYLLDTFGNEVLLHVESPGCFDPMPLGPRPRPPIIPSRIDLTKTEGYYYVENVYVGTGMETIEPGSVKYLRVVESPEKRFWTGPAWDGGTGQQAPGMAWNDFNNKRIIGTAPVEPDGSAYVAVPADTFVYFQLLDERGMMIQSMRSGTIVRPGETSGCVGCHEPRHSSAQWQNVGTAWQQGPRHLEPWYGPPRLPGFHLRRALVGGQVAMLRNHLAGQQVDLVAEVVVILAVQPEDAGHADMGEIVQAEVQDPHFFLQLVRNRILETAEHVVVGFPRFVDQEGAVGAVEVGAAVRLDSGRRTARGGGFCGVQSARGEGCAGRGGGADQQGTTGKSAGGRLVHGGCPFFDTKHGMGGGSDVQNSIFAKDCSTTWKRYPREN